MRLAWAMRPSAAWPGRLAIAEHWTPPPFPLTGDDVAAAGVAPGPAMGRLLRTLQDEWLAQDFPPDRAALLARLADLAGRPA